MTRGRGYDVVQMPSPAEIEFFARWNEAARRADRSADDELTMSDRLEAVAQLSAAVAELQDRVRPVLVCSRTDLLTMKRAAGRPQDLEDLRMLGA